MQYESLNLGGTLLNFLYWAIPLCQKAVKSYWLLLVWRASIWCPTQKLCQLVSYFATFQLPSSSQSNHLKYNRRPQNWFYTNSRNAVASWGSTRMPLHFQIWTQVVVPHQINSILDIAKMLKNLQQQWCKANTSHPLPYLGPQSKCGIPTSSRIPSVNWRMQHLPQNTIVMDVGLAYHCMWPYLCNWKIRHFANTITPFSTTITNSTIDLPPCTSTLIAEYTSITIRKK